jgi:hypothetical protein
MRGLVTERLATTGSVALALWLVLAPAAAQSALPWLDPTLLAAARAEGSLTV